MQALDLAIGQRVLHRGHGGAGLVIDAKGRAGRQGKRGEGQGKPPHQAKWWKNRKGEKRHDRVPLKHVGPSVMRPAGNDNSIDHDGAICHPRASETKETQA
ncbi:hypothetical protein ABWH93_00485 [Seohaeicola saemankumensis]|uniref:hypothetical protein n=1 Tax=Seohaeicola TaxID=481178 RepID=UPI0035CE8902